MACIFILVAHMYIQISKFTLVLPRGLWAYMWVLKWINVKFTIFKKFNHLQTFIQALEFYFKLCLKRSPFHAIHSNHVEV
jgi:hypothetical protein